MRSASFSQRDESVDIQHWIPSTCGICSIGCGVEVAAANGRRAGVRGRASHPVNDGRLGPKGLNQYYANRHSTRARYPLIRNRQRELVRASSDEAMGLVAQRFNDALAAEGPDGVGIWPGALEIGAGADLEGEYVRDRFSARTVWRRS